MINHLEKAAWMLNSEEEVQARQAEMYHQAMADAGGHAGPYTLTPTFDCEVLCFKGFGADQQEFSKMQMMNYLKKCPSILTPSP